MGAPPGRMLNQSDWPQKSGNKPHHHKTRDWEPRDRSVLLGSLSLLLSAWAPLPNTVYRFVSSCLSLDTHPECYTRAFSRVLEGVPLPATVWHVLLLPAGLLAGGDASDHVADVPLNLMGFGCVPW